jgi:hypothetical protein
VTIGELRAVLYEIGLLSAVEFVCIREGTTLAEAHGLGEMRHQRRARVAVYALLREKWSRAKIADAFNRKAIDCRKRGRAA